MNAIGSCFVLIISLIGTISATEIILKYETKFFYYVLSEHNEYRERHGSQHLKFDYDAILEAKRLVKKYANERIVETSEKYGVNKNIINLNDMPPEYHIIAKKVVAEWYCKSNGYDYNIEPPNHDADAFTQIVWDETKQIGVSIELSDNNMLYVIVTYFPKGNIHGEYINNVFEPKEDDNELFIG